MAHISVFEKDNGTFAVSEVGRGLSQFADVSKIEEPTSSMLEERITKIFKKAGYNGPLAFQYPRQEVA